MTYCTDHVAARCFHHVAGVLFERMAKRVISSQEEPALASAVDDGSARAIGERNRVVRIVDGIWRAVLVGQPRACCTNLYIRPLLLGSDLGTCKCRRRIGPADTHVGA